VSAVTKPLLVLSPKLFVRVAASASGAAPFPRGATIDIFLKQKVSDSVDPVTFVPADQNGNSAASA
jgi:hypothetical protein